MKKLSALFSVIRPINLAITFITVIAASFIAGIHNLNPEILLGAFSLSLAAAAGYVINDIFDLEIDKINRPSRPIPSKQISLPIAYSYYFLLVLISLASALYINTAILLFILIINLIVFYYSSSLKKLPLVGNITVALLTSSAFILGGFLTGNIEASIVPAFFAFLVNLIREIVKDVEDIEGDKANYIKTFPIKFGKTISRSLVTALIILLIISTTIPFFFELYRIEYFIIVMCVVNVLFVYIIKKLKSNDYRKISNLLKLNMIFGLVAIYFGIPV